MPFINWGAAESIQVDVKNQTFFGVNDRRKSAGKAVGF